MNKKGLNLWLLLTVLLVSTACIEQKITVSGNVNNIAGNAEENFIGMGK